MACFHGPAGAAPCSESVNDGTSRPERPKLRGLTTFRAFLHSSARSSNLASCVKMAGTNRPPTPTELCESQGQRIMRASRAARLHLAHLLVVSAKLTQHAVLAPTHDCSPRWITGPARLLPTEGINSSTCVKFAGTPGGTPVPVILSHCRSER